MIVALRLLTPLPFLSHFMESKIKLRFDQSLNNSASILFFIQNYSICVSLFNIFDCSTELFIYARSELSLPYTSFSITFYRIKNKIKIRSIS